MNFEQTEGERVADAGRKAGGGQEKTDGEYRDGDYGHQIHEREAVGRPSESARWLVRCLRNSPVGHPSGKQRAGDVDRVVGESTAEYQLAVTAVR